MCIRLLNVSGSGSGVRLLDVGSGTGGFAELFCRLYPEAKLRGLEMSRTGTELAAQRVPTAEFEQRDLLETQAPGRSRPFGATHAVCSEELEHLDNPSTLLRNVIPYLASGCRIVVTVPGGKPNAFDRYIGHRRHYAAADLLQLLEDVASRSNLRVVLVFPFSTFTGSSPRGAEIG